MENPEIFVHDYVSEEPSNFDSLSTFLHKLTTEEMWEEEYTSMNLRLFYQDEKSNKFWEIKVIGKCHEIRFGKTGSEGQKKVKEFDTAQIAFKEANRLVAEKKNKGYQE
jgi:predicted DNA-binding WGR domain protein